MAPQEGYFGEDGSTAVERVARKRAERRYEWQRDALVSAAARAVEEVDANELEEFAAELAKRGLVRRG